MIDRLADLLAVSLTESEAALLKRLGQPDALPCMNAVQSESLNSLRKLRLVEVTEGGNVLLTHLGRDVLCSINLR